MKRFLATLGLLALSTPSFASGYARLDFQRGSEARLGFFAPVSRTVAVSPVVRLSGQQAELDVGVTADIGSLYVSGWVGGGLRYTATVPFVGPGLAFAFEAPPIPLYFESQTELRFFEPFGGTGNELLKRDMLLITVRRGLSLGGQVEPQWKWPGGLQTNHIGPRVNIGFRGGDALGVFVGSDTLGSGVLARVTLLLRF